MITNIKTIDAGQKIRSTLLENVQFQIGKHIADPELSVTKLLRYVGISRTNLHRKLTRMVGMSATEYIRHLRLQHAAILLVEQTEWSISEIACEVGFNSQSYFTRSFIKVFGMCPTAYRKKHHPK
jgi:AraC-like DNA-binding protein